MRRKRNREMMCDRKGEISKKNITDTLLRKRVMTARVGRRHGADISQRNIVYISQRTFCGFLNWNEWDGERRANCGRGEAGAETEVERKM